MDVLLVNNLYPPHDLGGGGKSLSMLARGFRGTDVSPTVATLTPDMEREMEHDDGTPIYRLPLRNLYWPFSLKGHRRFLKAIFNVVELNNSSVKADFGRLLSEIKPDLVRTKNLYGLSTSVWSACQDRDIPVVHTLSDYYLVCLHASLKKNNQVCQSQCWDCQLWNRGRKQRTRLVQGVTGVSQYVLNKHIDFGFFESVDHTAVIPPPVDFDGDWNQKTSPGNRVCFGFLGRLDREKGVEIFLEAVDQFDTGTIDAIVAGDGPDQYVSTLEPRMIDAGIDYLGYTPPDEFFAKVDVLIVPSLIPETFGRVVVEAFQHNVPVIGSRRGALPELIEEGINGWTVEPGDVDELVSTMRRLVDTPDLLDRSSDGYQAPVEDARLSRVSRQYVELFEHVLSQQTNPS